MADVSGWAVALSIGLIVLWLVLSGRLVSRRVHQDTIDERNHYRTALEVSSTTNGQLVAQVTELRVVNRFTADAMRAIAPNAPREEAPPQ